MYKPKLPGNLGTGTGTGTPLFEKRVLAYVEGTPYIFIYIHVIVTSYMHIDFFINYES